PMSFPHHAAAGAVRTSPPGPGYAELHCHTNFSFLDGASHPEELVEEAGRLGLAALAVTDHDGLYGVVRFARAARAIGLPTVFGAELTVADPGAPPARVVTRRGPGGATGARSSLGVRTTGERGAGERSGVPDPPG